MKGPILKIMDNKNEIGRLGEKKALDYLETLGFQQLEQNFRIGRGEIDIIVIKEEMLVFVEVKTHSNQWSQGPKVSWYQQNKIQETAQRYLDQYYWEGQIRYDVIEVYLDDLEEIKHYLAEFG